MTLTLVRDPFRPAGADGADRAVRADRAAKQDKDLQRPDGAELRRMDAELAAIRDEEPVGSEDFEDAVEQILAFQREDGSFSYFSDYRMDSDCRVSYVFRPSYACCQILMRAALAAEGELADIGELLDALRRGLEFCCARGLAGHGFDSELQQTEDLRDFVNAGYLEFSRAFPGLCPEFDEMVGAIVSSYERRVRECRTIFAFGVDLTSQMAELAEAFGREVKMPVFVYGTLMEGMANAGRLRGCAHLGAGRVDGYAPYDLGEFPGMRPSDEGGCVLGEVRLVDARVLKDLDELEGNGSLYRRIAVDVCLQGAFSKGGGTCRAWAYEYLGEVGGATRIPEQLQPWPRARTLRDSHVWYVAYGSSMSYERFMCYLEGGTCKDNGRTYVGCDDTTPPLLSIAVPVMHDVYFGNSSASWGGAGVAFLDVDNPGLSHARAYLITREQFEQVHDQEGGSGQWYGRVVELGRCAGIPMMTFTSRGTRPRNAPSCAYLEVMRRGMLEAYPCLDEKFFLERQLDACSR